MPRLSLLFVGAALALTLALPAQPTGEPLELTVGQLVDKNIAAKGGREALDALRSVRLTGRMLVNQDQLELGFAQTKKRGNLVRAEVSLQGLTMVQAYDGSQAWQIAPFQGRKDPEKMSADDAKSLIEDADLTGFLVDWKAKGSTVEYAGREDVDGTLAHKLKVTLKNGDVAWVYLDPDHFLEIRIVSQRIERGAQVEVETDLGDYEKVGGVFLPFSIEAGRKGSTSKQKILITKGEANPELDDAQFRFPASAQPTSK
ncbi:MAG: hypothetical protein JSR82_05185 [Verrucomicrobia bacterium]|nr:hypothetical protein [Verrucomicrobiota bacterium]